MPLTAQQFIILNNFKGYSFTLTVIFKIGKKCYNKHHDNVLKTYLIIALFFEELKLLK
jgi:hypothetical protein